MSHRSMPWPPRMPPPAGSRTPWRRLEPEWMWRRPRERQRWLHASESDCRCMKKAAPTACPDPSFRNGLADVSACQLPHRFSNILRCSFSPDQTEVVVDSEEETACEDYRC